SLLNVHLHINVSAVRLPFSIRLLQHTSMISVHTHTHARTHARTHTHTHTHLEQRLPEHPASRPQTSRHTHPTQMVRYTHTHTHTHTHTLRAEALSVCV